MNRRSAWLTWLASRLVVLVLLFSAESRVVGDVGYFAHAIRGLGAHGVAHTMPEYPVASLALVVGLWGLAGLLGSSQLFGFLLVSGCLAVDALFLRRLLGDADADRRQVAVWVWVLAIPLMGSVSYARLDLLSGVLVAVMLLSTTRSYRRAAGLVSIATCLKLWPVLLIPTMLLRLRGRARRQAAPVVVASGGLALVATAALGGWGRVVSPLVYQADRGLQVESLAATPAMVQRLLDPAGSRVFFSRFLAYEVRGPMTGPLTTLTTVLSALLIIVLVVTWVRLLLARRTIGVDSQLWLTLSATSGFLCASKVFSPQYLLWLLPVASVGLLVAHESYRPLRRWVAGLLMVTAMSHAIWPWLYGPLAGPPAGATSVLAVAVLTARNLVTLALLVEAARQTRLAMRRDAERAGQSLRASSSAMSSSRS